MEEIAETSYGVIPIHFEMNSPLVLIVKKSNGGFWSFPKGHPTPEDEDEKQTAKRELFEETKLEVIKFFDLGPFVENYQFPRDGQMVNKKVVLFSAQTTSEFKIDQDEIIDAKWVSFETLVAHLTYDEAKGAAKNFLKAFKL